MIRFFVLTGLVGGALVAYLTTAGVGPISQLPPPESLLTRFREEGFVPESPNLAEDESAEEAGVFEVPDSDEAHLEEAQAAFDKMMGGMDMSGMNMGSSGGDSMDMNASDGGGMNMAEGGSSADSGSMNMNASDGGGMNMAEGGSSADSGSMDMNASDGGGMKMAEGGSSADSGSMDMNASDGGGMKMAEGGSSADSGSMDMNASDGGGMKMAGDMGMEMGEGGLLVTEDGPYDREIVLTMSEWKFSDMKIDVKPGERIRFTVRNGGQIPHEFMFMSPPLMQAVNYRATRADWSLFEHEALFEKALVLPGGEFSFVLKVTQPGSWMFMCMLPYHMQMGMMGQMATEGMAMDM